MSATLLDVLEQLTAEERREVDEHIVALSSGHPHTHYQHDPLAWARDVLGVPIHTLRWSLNPGYDQHAWDGSVDPLALLFDAARDGKDVACESGTGTGKSFGMAVLILWFLACYEGARVFTFAPKEDQLRLYIWTEIGKLWERFQVHFPDANLSDLRIQMHAGENDWSAVGYSVGVVVGESVSTKASGMHAPHMMLVYEETPGIPLQVIEAGENACTAPHNFRVAIGNPNHKLDALHRFAVSPGVVHIRMSALDHPNVVTGNSSLIPGAISRQSIDRRRVKYGETSPVYQSRVRGMSPEQASDALIRLEWLEASAARFAARSQRMLPYQRLTGKGVDVANSEHGDRACIADFCDNAIVRLHAFQCPDSNALGRQVVMEMDAGELKPEYVGIDSIGVGAGTVNECRRLRRNVQALNASSAPFKNAQKSPDGSTYEWAADANQFKNFRSQMYWQLREDYRLGQIDAPRDDELWEELTAHTFVDEPKTVIEPKDEVRERIGRSPDKAEAVALGNWARRRKARTLSAYEDLHGAAGHDPLVTFRTSDGKPPRWIGPGDEQGDEGFTGGYAEQFPVGLV